ncbi:Glutamyl-tRNA(Gln) amidotransferase subunit D [Candidatus Bilamarchaeum dharawalense]|uniref:Glutamyl-tRNA(Gln) amidotransferase subunit D n=1 Tax=Candidatus Bilamarchaeum dharawalense TaxID=2885759 RepID=A0A5E4LQN8_9ARCH|nr:Glutamyl-tRNA(Gln) amidotransferase subunit D [Candidatus Bilamarchaeum dharawalense]
MYSSKITKEINEKKISIGDRIRVRTVTGEFEGLLMPRPSSGDPNLIVLKLDSGYNTGLKPESIELVAKAELKKSNDGGDSESKEGIAILGCGGTIASKIEYKTGAVFPSISPKELRMIFPALKNWSIHSKQIFSLLSEDMNSHHWKLLADSVEAEIKDGSEGVVVMHGTDTMTYTSSVLGFMLQQLPVPVVFVGSQRSSDRPSSENEMNMLNSVFAASQDLGEVTVCMHASTNDDFCYLHRGNRVRKMHTSSRDAFRSIDSSPLFAVDYRTKKFDKLSDFMPRNNHGLIAKKSINDNVALIYSHPNMKPEFFRKLSDYDGVVLIGTGLGHVAANAFNDKSVNSVLKPIEELVQSGIPVVMSSQCISGRICMRVYTTGRLLMEAGVIGDGADWTPETAYTKLCWVLGQTKDMKEVKKLMMTNIAGEISTRSNLEGY